MKSIVVGTDFSEGSIVALDVAVIVANSLQCGIRLIWARKEKNLFDSEQMETATRLAEHRLQDLCDERKGKLLYGHIEWEVLSGKVANVISRAARHCDAPMIIIGTCGASGFEKYWMGSTAVRIIQESPCPVLTIRQGFDTSHGIRKILVPIRVHINSRQKVNPALQVAKNTGAAIHVLGLSASDQDDSDLSTYIRQIEKLVDKENIPMTSQICRYSNYADTVLDVADELGIDLIVINTEQDRVIAQMFLGTNAQQIVHRAQIPVMCLHPKDIVNFAK